jgi:hypothetical protein
MKKLTLLCAALACLAAAPAFAAGSTKCTGSQLPAYIPGSLDIPAGQVCNLYGQEVAGNVTVEGTLNSYGTRFDGNVTVTGGVIVISNGNGQAAGLMGNLTITGSAGNSQIGCPNISNVIGGNLTYTGNSGNLYVCQAYVGGTVNVNNNIRINNDYSGPYSADLENITAAKNISCSGNTLVQGGGLVAPQVTGDCAPFIKQ